MQETSYLSSIFLKFSGGACPQTPLGSKCQRHLQSGAEGALTAHVQIFPFFTWISSFSISINHYVRSQGWQPCKCTKVEIFSCTLLCYCKFLLVLAKYKGILNKIMIGDPQLLFHIFNIKYF